MSDEKSLVDEVVHQLKQQRDELALQIHLGRKEAQEEWDAVQQKLDRLLDDYEPVKDAVEASAGDVIASLKLVAGEIGESFQRIRASLTDEEE